MFVELRFKALEECERYGTGKSGKHPVARAAHFARGRLRQRFQSPGHRRPGETAVAANEESCP
jgi:hypothetical protein